MLLTAVLALGLYSACDEPEKIEEPINNNGNDNGKDTVDNKKDTIQVVPLGANQLRIGKDTISFTITDTLTVQEGAMRVFSWNDDPVTINSIGSLNVDLNNDFLGKDINLSLTNLMDTVYDPLSFNFVVSGGSDSLFITLDWERDDNDQLRHILAGAINTDTVHSIFQTGTLRMDLDTPKKIFTFKINATLFDGRAFELFVSMPYRVQYIFNFYTYSHETYDPSTGRTLTDFSAFDPISDYLETFTLEAADTSAQAKFAVFKEAVGKLETIISLVNDSIAKEGFYNDKDCFMVKLITWGYGGNNRVLGYKKWFKTYVETWIPTDATLREKLYSTEDEDYWENYGWDD